MKIIKKDSNETRASASIEAVCQALQNADDESALPKQGGAIDSLAQNLLFVISRKRAWMDWQLERRVNGRIRPRVRRVLWWAMAQMFFLDGLPVPVTVDTACRFVKKHYSQSDASFVNAVLRRLDRERTDAALMADDQAPDWVRAGLSKPLWDRWRRQLGPETTERIARLLQTEAPLTCRLKNNARDPRIPVGLRPLDDCDWCGSWRVFAADEKLREIPLDTFYIQDPSTLLSVVMLDPRPGERIADLCAAPGGKSLMILECLGASGHLACCDRSAQRLDRVRKNLGDRPNVVFKAEDAVKTSLENAAWNAVLLDVPCSNTGVVRRRPDVRWTFSEQKLHELAALQADILDRAAALVAPGGRLVYSTCSIDEDEDEAQITRFLNAHPDFKLENSRKLLPDETHDGAFAARLAKLK